MANEEILAFLDAIDHELWKHAEHGETLDLHLLGRSALVLGYGFQLMTKDVDIVRQTGSRLLEIVIGQFSRTAPGRDSRRFYIEEVSSGLPPLPPGYQGRCTEIPGSWRVIRPMRPEVHDLIVSKLTRFHQGDREDIRILCDSETIDAAILLERFQSAHSFSDRDDPKVVAAIANLQTVNDYLSGTRKHL